METILFSIKMIYILSGSLWVGEVVVINVVLLPTLFQCEGEYRRHYLIRTFPKVFRLATVLVLVSILSGGITLYTVVDGDVVGVLLGTWGVPLLIGGLLEVCLTIFHLIMSPILQAKVSRIQQGAKEELHAMYRLIAIIPRVGLCVISTAYVLITIAFKMMAPLV